MQLGAGVILEVLYRLFDARTRLDLVGHLRLLRDDSCQLLFSPLIGLVGVDLCSEESLAQQRIALRTNGIFGVCCRQQFGLQKLGEDSIALGRLFSGSGQFFAKRIR